MNQSNLFVSRINWKLGDGNRIRSWEDRWISDGPLKEKFPRLYLISLCKDKVISEVGEWANIAGSETCTCNLSWRRELFVWEEEQIHQLTTLIVGAQWKRSVSDGWIWNDNNLKEYTVRSRYKVLSEFGS